MERYTNLDKLPHALEVMLPHRSDGIGYALRRAYPAAPGNSCEFSDLLGALNAMLVSGRSG